MEPASERRIILITRKTRLDDLIARFNTEAQARFYIEHLGDDYQDYKEEHETYYKSLATCSRVLAKSGRLHRIDRTFLPNYTFGASDLVVVLGQDGLVANTIKYLDAHPVVGVNPDPGRWDGVLLPFTPKELGRVIGEVMQGKRPHRDISMAKVELNTGEQMHAVNDFFIGPKSHTSARYIISTRDGTEEQSSSGIIVSTGLGATGWFKSLIVGATGIASKLTGKSIRPNPKAKFTWESRFLCFTVREPFPSNYSEANIVFGYIEEGNPLRLISRMAGNGVIFSDGIEPDFLEFNSGTEAVISLASKKGNIIQ